MSTRVVARRLVGHDTPANRRMVATAWLGSRAALLLVALRVSLTKGRSWHEMLSAWDVQHFETIATHGYVDPIDRAFFPALPLLLRTAQGLGIPMAAAGVVLGLVCSGLAAWALLRLGGPVAASLWLVAPATVFTAVAYTEAPFCAAAFWAWERATRGRWGQAAALACLACTFRVSGLFLVGGLCLLALTRCGDGWGERIAHCATAALGVAGVLAYFAYLHQLTGSWTAWFDAQAAGWNRGLFTPLESFRHTLDAGAPDRWPGRPEVAWVFRAEVVSMVVGTLVTIVCLVKRRWAHAGYVGVQVFAFATSYWFMSVNRAVLLWFPLWLGVAALADDRRAAAVGSRSVRLGVGRLAVGVFALGSTAAMVAWAWLFLTGAWAS